MTPITNPILDITEFELPLDISYLFNNRKKTALEIGFGEGEFITKIGTDFENWNFLGIEIKYGRFKKAVRKIQRAKLENVKLIHIDAEIAVEQIFEVNSFDHIFINFPDPWPKERHKKHRLISRNFITNTWKIMKKNALFEFTSDHSEYIEHTIDSFKMVNNFQKLDDLEDSKHEFANRPLTKFEKEFIEEGRNIKNLTYKKISLTDHK